MDRREFIKKAGVAAGAMMLANPLETFAANTNEKKVMKVLLLNGSPHDNGNTRAALDEAAKELQSLGVETEVVNIGTDPVRSCVACQGCKGGGDRCVFDDDICNGIIEKMEQADGLIVGSPVYYGQPNGAVLSLMQRMFYSASSKLEYKPAAGVCVCRRGGATAAFQTLNMPFQMTNMPVVTSQYWNIVYGTTPGEAKLDREGMQTMRTMARNMAWMLESVAANPNKPERERPQGMNFIR